MHHVTRTTKAVEHRKLWLHHHPVQNLDSTGYWKGHLYMQIVPECFEMNYYYVTEVC